MKSKKTKQFQTKTNCLTFSGREGNKEVEEIIDHKESIRESETLTYANYFNVINPDYLNIAIDHQVEVDCNMQIT